VAAGQGLSRCLSHPGEPFAPHIGCATCNASTDTGPEDVEPAGEGEMQCAEADRRGLPDAFEVEARMWNVWRTATRRAETAAAIADKLSRFQEEGAGKLATGPVLHRERMAELERRARLVRGSKGKH
jgi:hypothetical protein